MKTLAMLLGLLVVTSNAVGENKVVERSDAEKKAIAAIKKLGGKVTLDEKKPGKPVISVDLNYTKVADAGLVHLQGLTKLQTLRLIASNVPDAGLVDLKDLTELQVLWLYKTKITDTGLVHLKGLTELQSLELYNTKVTEAGVKKLQSELPKCRIMRKRSNNFFGF